MISTEYQETSTQLLLAAIRRPDVMSGLTIDSWNKLLWGARHTKLLARLAETNQAMAGLPKKVSSHLEAASAEARACHRSILWEIKRVNQALIETGVPIILLKGAAYVAAGLPRAKGRVFNDLDIMVPKESLKAVELALHHAGWEKVVSRAYDDHYYRQWMHELPPMRHKVRQTILDVHHTILPESSRSKPVREQLWQESRPIRGDMLRILCPEDMVLHSAAHAFHDGQLDAALRDVVDLHDLLSHFDTMPRFWPRLMERATLHNLERPLFYSLRYAKALLGTQISTEIEKLLASRGPSNTALRMMDALVPRSVLPDQPVGSSRSASLARMLLYVRSHWLRMPPHLLIGHLGRKVWFRIHSADSNTQQKSHSKSTQ